MFRKILTKSYRIGFTLILLSLFSFGHLLAQKAKKAKGKDSKEESVCTQNLDQARTLFDDGRIHEIPAKLEPCLQNGGFLAAEETEALRLLVLTHIYLEEPEKANERMLQLLKHEHEFQPNPAVDPTEFVLLFQTYRTKPIFNLTLKLGANSTFIQTTAVNGVYNIAETGNRGKNGLKPNFQAAIGAEFTLSPVFTLAPEIQYSSQTWQFTSLALVQDQEPDLEADSIGYRGSSLTLTRGRTWLKLPIMVEYKFKPGKFNPYITLGPSFDYLISAQIPGDQNALDMEGKQSSEVATKDKLDELNRFNIAIALGAGVKLKVGEGFITGEIRYQHGLMKAVNKFYDSNTAWDLKDVNSQYKEHIFQVSLGYILNIYAPKKNN